MMPAASQKKTQRASAKVRVSVDPSQSTAAWLREAARKSGKKKGSLMYNGVTAFWVTLLNPLIVFLFMAAFAQLNFVIPDRPLEMSIGYLSILGGALLWWFGLTWLIDLIREKFDTNGIFIINKSIGTVVIVISLVIMFGTIFNLYHIHY